ncbi:ribbon-helix-helix domain-containing protein [Candidatus Poriferisocius sp.]|uniref:ribbon-helix-helix domain-containing protein n=1 Tax=Candidatus Poriferisocius sp. TaxID=3101276 RepID=UPI003B5B98EF
MTATVPIPVRFEEKQVQAIDRLVDEGVGETRSEVIRRAVERLEDTVRRARIEQEIIDSYREQPQSPDEDAAAMAAAIALIEAEPWVWTEDGQFIPKHVASERGIPLGPGPSRPHSGAIEGR